MKTLNLPVPVQQQLLIGTLRVSERGLREMGMDPAWAEQGE